MDNANSIYIVGLVVAFFAGWYHFRYDSINNHGDNGHNIVGMYIFAGAL